MKQSTLRIEAISLALIAGYVDGYALRVFGIFVSFMSGNTTLTGVSAGQGKFLTAIPPALAVFGFVGGSFVGSWFVHSGLQYSRRLLFIVAAMLIACFVALNLHALSQAKPEPSHAQPGDGHDQPGGLASRKGTG
jgi:uncharacterized membrane protein YoaK (UPF0700 family)